MKVIGPVDITSSMLISSTAPETDLPAWSAGTTYALHDLVVGPSTPRIYESLSNGNLNNTPETSPTWWADVGATNRWAMFDSQVSSATELTSPLTVEVAPGYVNALALIGLVGNQVDVTVTDGAGGPTVYSNSIVLDGAIIGDWYAYVFEPQNQLTQVVLTDLPPYSAARLTVSITGGATVACAVMSVGTVYEIGDTQQGVKLGIIDYSRKDTDAYGTTTFVRRKFSRQMSAQLYLSTSQINAVMARLSALRAVPCVWIGSTDTRYAPMVIFGFYRDFSVTVAYASLNLCNLEIEGLT